MKCHLISKISILITCFQTLHADSQESYYIAAPSGLILRESPKQTSEKLELLPFLDEIEIIEKLKPELTIQGKKGQWFKTKYKTGTSKSLEGWVFSGFLATSDIILNQSRKKNGNRYSFQKVPGGVLNRLLNLYISRGNDWTIAKYNGYYTVNSSEIIDGPFFCQSR